MSVFTGVSALLLVLDLFHPLKLARPHLSNGCVSEGAVYKADSPPAAATLRVSAIAFLQEDMSSSAVECREVWVSSEAQGLFLFFFLF